jgi:hypothetical protein
MATILDTDFAIADVTMMLRDSWSGMAEGNDTSINEIDNRPYGQLGDRHMDTISIPIQVRSEALQRYTKSI